MSTRLFGIYCLFLLIAGIANAKKDYIDHPNMLPMNKEMKIYQYYPRNFRVLSRLSNNDYWKPVLEDTYDINYILNKAPYSYRGFENEKSKEDEFEDTNPLGNVPSDFSRNDISATDYSTSYETSNAGSSEVTKVSNSDSSGTDNVQSSMKKISSLETSITSSQNSITPKYKLGSTISNPNNEPSNSNMNETNPGVSNSLDPTADQGAQSTEDPNTLVSDTISSSTQTSILPTTDFDNVVVNETSISTKNETGETSLSVTDSASNSGMEDFPSTGKQNTLITNIDLLSSAKSTTDSNYSVLNTTSNSIVNEISKTSSIVEIESNSEKEQSIDYERTSKSNTIPESTLGILYTTLNPVPEDSTTMTTLKDVYLQSTDKTKVSKLVAESTKGSIIVSPASDTVRDQTSKGRYSTRGEESNRPEDENNILLISQPEHIIKISSIRTIKMVVSVVFLVVALVATTVLTIFMIKIKRREVQYDQLTLLP